MQRIRIQRVRPNAIVPTYSTPESVGFDLVACETVEVSAHAVAKVPLGWKMEVPVGFQLEIRPHPQTTLTTDFLVVADVIGAEYHDEVCAIVRNECNSSSTVCEGARIAQGVLMPVIPVSFRICELV